LKHYVKTGVLEEVPMDGTAIPKDAKKAAEEAAKDAEKQGEELAQEAVVAEEGIDNGTDVNEEVVSESIAEEPSPVELSPEISDKPKSFVSSALLEKLRKSQRKT
jgi:hypothetical protein